MKKAKNRFFDHKSSNLRGSGSYYIIIKVIMSAICHINFMTNAPHLGLIEVELYFFDLAEFF